MMKLSSIMITVFVATYFLVGCDKPADIASRNLSQEADNFKVNRRVIFYNTRIDKYLITLEGYCSLGNDDKAGELSVTCKVGPDTYVKDFLGLSRDVTYFAHQIEPQPVNTYHYKVFFTPSALIPNVEMP